MLAALVRQAQHAGLTVEPGFAPKDIRWIAQVSGGKLTGVIGNGRTGISYPRCPEMSHPELMALPRVLGKPQAAHFLADTCGVVALLPALDRDGNARTDDRSQAELAKFVEKHPSYLELLRRASADIPELTDLLNVLTQETQLAFLRAELARNRAKSTDKLSFSVGGTDLLGGDLWHAWWRRFRREAFGRQSTTDGGGMLDFTSGQPVTPAHTHPKLTKLGVGAIAMGASLVGYDKEAFGSYGLNAGENGAVSAENAAAYRAALENLLVRAPILGQMKVAAWFDHRQLEGQALMAAIEDPASLGEDVLEALKLDDVDENEVVLAAQTPEQQEAVAQQRGQKLLTAIRRGEQPESVTAQYFALAISGASGRAMVRDWKTGQLDHLASAVVTWFDDLAITNLSGKRANRPKFFSLLTNVQRPRQPSTSMDDYLKPIRNLQLPLWRAALDPAMPIPFPAVAKVMEAHKSHVMTGAFTEALGRDGAGAEEGRIYIRMAILRAYHVRKARHQGGYPMHSSVDPKHPSPAYHCGRLMYLLANVQDAQGDTINAGVVQRYYGAASSTPALVLGRLTRLSQHHLAKISRDKPGLAFQLEQEIASVWAALGQQPPKTLSLEEQSLFALGYYQQLARSVASRKETAAKNRADAAHPSPATAPQGLLDTDKGE
ncbi:type I-C CRISPR-associated protein Cas8c/Csd1 [Deinococcus sp.]|uniref:type I-C CRISPR-associated protein Cas8c/Csd1 n=1 Tax=Deinococcus sp. TaxID=47478 RepID=UPI0025B8E7B5|nr:type I-C CRISPR-associated protein Cas8c/Csd1 [Deinococcus sp.]